MDIDWWHPPIVDLTHYYQKSNKTIHCLDLSKVHPIVSGNKFYKLWGYLKEYEHLKKKGIVSMGGAHSNHLHALSYYCYLQKIPCIALIRQSGNDAINTPTCKDLQKWNTIIIPLSPSEFRALRDTEQYHKYLPDEFDDEWYWIPEGGKGDLGTLGLEQLFLPFIEQYDTFFINVGTGTSMISLIHIAQDEKPDIIGVAPFKKIHEQEEYIFKNVGHKSYCKIVKDPWGLGFGKVNEEIKNYVKKINKNTKISLDYIYTSRLFLAFEIFLNSSESKYNENVLLIHGGGLQGNRRIDEVY